MYQISLEQLERSMEADKKFTTEQIEAEKTRAETEEAKLQTDIDSVRTAAAHDKQEVEQQIQDETARATAAESSLEAKIDDEIKRATNAENVIANDYTRAIQELKASVDGVADDLASEVTRSTTKDTELQTEVNQVKSDLAAEVERSTTKDQSVDRKIADLTQSTNDNTGLITDLLNADEAIKESIAQETTRATAKETELGELIDSEKIANEEKFEDITGEIESLTARVDEASADVDSKIEAERSRATAKEEELSTAITTETNRAKTREDAIDALVSALAATVESGSDELKASIASEVTRATEAEQSLSNQLTAETNRATSAEDVLGTRITNAKNELETSITDLTTSLTAETTRATKEEEKLAGQIRDNKTTVDGQLDALSRQITDIQESLDTVGEGVDAKIKVETDRALAAEAALTQKINDDVAQEASARSSQIASVTGDVDALRETVTTSVASINGQLDQVNTTMATTTTELNTLKKTAVVGYKANPSTESNPYTLSGVNAEGTVVNTIPVASDPDDPTNADAFLVNRKYAKAMMSALEAADQATNTNVTALTGRMDTMDTTVSGVDGKVDTLSAKVDEKLDASPVSDTVVSMDPVDGVLVTTTQKNLMNGTTTSHQTKFISPDDSVHAVMNTDLNGVPIVSVTSIVKQDVIDGIKADVLSQVHLPTGIVSGWNLKAVANVPVGEQPEYGYVWKITSTLFNPADSSYTETPEEYNLFRVSGAWDVMNELYDEIARSKLEDEKLTAAIEAEVARATAKEGELETTAIGIRTDLTTLQETVDTLSNTTTAKFDSLKTELEGKVTAETTRATTAEEAIDKKADDEVTRATTAETAIDQKVDAEVTRATAKDTELATAIADESNRAISVEGGLSTRMDTLATADSNLSTRMDNLVTANTTLSGRVDTVVTDNATIAGKVDTLSEDITAETTRATAAEEALGTRVTALENATPSGGGSTGDIQILRQTYKVDSYDNFSLEIDAPKPIKNGWPMVYAYQFYRVSSNQTYTSIPVNVVCNDTTNKITVSYNAASGRVATNDENVVIVIMQ